MFQDDIRVILHVLGWCVSIETSTPASMRGVHGESVMYAVQVARPEENM